MRYCFVFVDHLVTRSVTKRRLVACESIKNLEVYARKLSWLNLRCNPVICLERTKVNYQKLIQNTQYPGRNSNLALPESKSEDSVELTCSILCIAELFYIYFTLLYSTLTCDFTTFHARGPEII
jgi:hypothetical protein